MCDYKHLKLLNYERKLKHFDLEIHYFYHLFSLFIVIFQILDSDPRDLVWKSCNTSSVPILVKLFDIKPPHFRLGTTLTIAFAVDIFEKIYSPIQVSIKCFGKT